MWRKFAVCALLFCAGCASQREDCVLKDSVLGDFVRLFHRSSPPPDAPYGK